MPNPYPFVRPGGERDERGFPVGSVGLSMFSLSLMGFAAYKYYPQVKESKFASGTRRVLRGLDRLPFVSGGLPFETPLPTMPATPIPMINRKGRFSEIWRDSKKGVLSYYRDLNTTFAMMRRSQAEEIVKRLDQIQTPQVKERVLQKLSERLNQGGASMINLTNTSTLQDDVVRILHGDATGEISQIMRSYVYKGWAVDKEIVGDRTYSKAVIRGMSKREFLNLYLKTDSYQEHATFRRKLIEGKVRIKFGELPDKMRELITRTSREKVDEILNNTLDVPDYHADIKKFPRLMRVVNSAGAVDGFFEEFFGKATDIKEFKFEDGTRTDALRHLQSTFHVQYPERKAVQELLREIVQMRGVDDVTLSHIRQIPGEAPTAIQFQVNISGKKVMMEFPLSDKHGVVRSKGMMRTTHRMLMTDRRGGVSVRQMGPMSLAAEYRNIMGKVIQAAAAGRENHAQYMVNSAFERNITQLQPFEARLSATFMPHMFHDSKLDEAIGIETKKVMVDYKRRLEHMVNFRNLKKANDFIVLDIETHKIGVVPTHQKPIKVAAKRYVNGKVVDTFHWFVNPKEYWSDYTQVPEQMRKPTEGFAFISKDEYKARRVGKTLMKLPNGHPGVKFGTSHEVFTQLAEWLGRTPERVPIVGHNIEKFDIPVLKHAARRAGVLGLDKKLSRNLIDTLHVARSMFIQGEVTDHKLETLLRQLLHKEQSQTHLAIFDVEDNMQLFKYFDKEFKPEEISKTIDFLKSGKTFRYISPQDKIEAITKYIDDASKADFAHLVNRSLLSSTMAARGRAIPIGIEHLTPFGFGMGFYAETDMAAGKITPVSKQGIVFNMAKALHAEHRAAFITPASREKLERFYERSFEPYFITRDMMALQEKAVDMIRGLPKKSIIPGRAFPHVNVMFTDNALTHEGQILIKESYARRVKLISPIPKDILIEAKELAGVMEDGVNGPRLNLAKFKGRAPRGHGAKSLIDILSKLNDQAAKVGDVFGLPDNNIRLDLLETGAWEELPVIRPGEGTLRNPKTPGVGVYKGDYKGRITSVELIGSSEAIGSVKLKIGVSMEIPLDQGAKLGGWAKGTFAVTADDIVDNIVGNKSLNIQMVAAGKYLTKNPGYFGNTILPFARDLLERKLASNDITQDVYQKKLQNIMSIIKTAGYFGKEHLPGGLTQVIQGMPSALTDLEAVSKDMTVPGMLGAREVKAVMKDVADVLGIQMDDFFKGQIFYGRMPLTLPGSPNPRELYTHIAYGDIQNVFARGAKFNVDAVKRMWDLIQVDRTVAGHLGWSEKQISTLREKLKPAVNAITSYAYGTQMKNLKHHGVGEAFVKVGYLVQNLDDIPKSTPVLKLSGDKWKLLERDFEGKETGRVLKAISKDAYDEFGNIVKRPGEKISSVKSIMGISRDFVVELPGGATLELHDKDLHKLIKRSVPEVFIPGAQDQVLRKTMISGVTEDEFGKLVPRELFKARYLNRSIQELLTNIEKGNLSDIPGSYDRVVASAAESAYGKRGLWSEMLGTRFTGSIRAQVMPVLDAFYRSVKSNPNVNWQQGVIDMLKLEPGTVRITREQFFQMYTENRRKILADEIGDLRGTRKVTRAEVAKMKSSYLSDLDDVVKRVKGRMNQTKGAKGGVIAEFFAWFARQPIHSAATSSAVVKVQIMDERGFLGKSIHNHILQIDQMLAYRIKADFDQDVANLVLVPNFQKAAKEYHETQMKIGGGWFNTQMKYSEEMPLFGKYRAVPIFELEEEVEGYIKRAEGKKADRMVGRFVTPRYDPKEGLQWHLARKLRSTRMQNVDAYSSTDAMVDSNQMRSYVNHMKTSKYIGMGMTKQKHGWLDRLGKLQGYATKFKDYMAHSLQSQLGRGGEKILTPASYGDFMKLMGRIETRAGIDAAADIAWRFADIMVQDSISSKHGFFPKLQVEVREGLRTLRHPGVMEKFTTGKFHALEAARLEANFLQGYAAEEMAATLMEIDKQAAKMSLTKGQYELVSSVMADSSDLFTASDPSYRLAHRVKTIGGYWDSLHVGETAMQDVQAVARAHARYLGEGKSPVTAARFVDSDLGTFYKSPTRGIYAEVGPQLASEPFAESMARTMGPGFGRYAKMAGKAAMIFGGIYAMLNVFNPNQMGLLGDMPGRGGEVYDIGFTEDELPRHIPLNAPMYTWKSPARIATQSAKAYERNRRVEQAVYGTMGIPVTTPSMARTPSVSMRYHSGRITTPQLREFLNNAVVGAI
jgi:hypothetical protein